MPWQDLLAPDIQRFIHENQNQDVAQLALKKLPVPDALKTPVLEQIKARQKARYKLAGWTEVQNVILPAPDVIEQGSSTATALYKAGIVRGTRFADLTGGTGMDCAVLAQSFKHVSCCEHDKRTAALLAHNLPLISNIPITVLHSRAEEFIQDMPDMDLVYIDPQRRDGSRKGLYNLADCSPNIFEMMPVLKEKAAAILIKTSPVLDIDKTIAELGPVAEVHIVEWQGECKEVLYLLRFNENSQETTIKAVSIGDHGQVLQSLSFTRSEESTAVIEYAEPQTYIYEPSAAFMKAGCFKAIAAQYGLKKLHPNTHLYTSDHRATDFPGRIFKLIDVLPADKKAAARALPNKKANITVRNFPSSPEELRKKLGLRDGGNDYLFACTTSQNKHVLLHTQKP